MVAQVQLSGSPIYVVEQRLGKGGFGQVCRGTRLVPRKATVPGKPNEARCAAALVCLHCTYPAKPVHGLMACLGFLVALPAGASGRAHACGSMSQLPRLAGSEHLGGGLSSARED